MKNDNKYEIVYDGNKRKGIKYKREGMYFSAWRDNDVSQNRWNPNEFGKEGNSLSAEAVESEEIDFFQFDVLDVGVFQLEKTDLLEFYKKHPLNVKYIDGNKRMVFPAKLWKKIQQS